jgi:hypothetical protein
MMPYAITALFVIAIIAVWVVNRKSRYYGRIFNDAHYAEVASWAASVLKRHPVTEPSMDDGTALLTSAGLALAYTSDIDEGNRCIHFSISQAGRYTTGAVGGRFIFLLIRLLNKNKCEANIFRTPSTVHHVEFAMPENTEWVIENQAKVVSDMENYQPLPIAGATD